MYHFVATFLCLVHLTSCLPASVSSDQAKLEEEFQHQLLNPDENLVDLDQKQNSTKKAKDIFPDRRGFITGHRIPLELFSKETIRRLKSVRIMIILFFEYIGIRSKLTPILE